jgi:hypothetical protein
MLVSEKVTGSYFAMKALKKEFIIKNDDVGRYGRFANMFFL